MKTVALACLSLIAACVAEAQSVPGFDVTTYASVSDPVMLSFAPGGDLYVGRDLSGSGGVAGDPTRIHRVLAGGGTVEEFGGIIADPDAVLFDASGLFAPSPGSVLVGSQASLTTGQISAIAPGGAVSLVFGPTSAFNNPTDLTFDGTGRLLFVDFQEMDVKVSSGATPSNHYTLSSTPVSIAYDPATDRIYTSGSDGDIRVHESDGTLINATFATGRPLAISTGGLAYGFFLYTVDSGTGELIRIDAAGNQEVFGTGFTSVIDLAFGPDGALYVSEFDNDRILRIAPRSFLQVDWDKNHAIQAHGPVLHPSLLIGLQPLFGSAAVTQLDNETIVLDYSSLSPNEEIQIDLASFGPPFYPPDPIKVVGNTIEIEMDEAGTMFTLVIELSSTTGEIIDAAALVGFDPQPEPPAAGSYAFSPPPGAPGEGLSLSIPLSGGSGTPGGTQISLSLQVLDDLDVALPLSIVPGLTPVPLLGATARVLLIAGMVGAAAARLRGRRASSTHRGEGSGSTATRSPTAKR